jgi:hypothetical protein
VRRPQAEAISAMSSTKANRRVKVSEEVSYIPTIFVYFFLFPNSPPSAKTNAAFNHRANEYPDPS